MASSITRLTKGRARPRARPPAAPAGLIADITTPGTPLAANALKVIDDGTILRSQANLVAARGAVWGEGERELARRLLDRIAAQARAHGCREVRTRFPACND